MRPRQPVPSVWLMTDERIGAALWPALRRLPRGAGVVFRHYHSPPAERRRLFARVLRVARARRLLLVRAGPVALRGEMGVHNTRGRGLRTASAHSRIQAVAARRAGAHAIFVSPVFATRSHPGTRPLGPVRLALMTRGIGLPVIALGGMTRQRFHGIAAHGWAAIDAWRC